MTARALHDWWAATLDAFRRFTENASDENAAIRRMLGRSAHHIVATTDIDDEGRLFSSACLSLGSLCRLLDTIPGVSRWQEALDDVLAPPVAGSLIQATQIASPAAVYRDRAAEHLLHAGVVEGAPSSIPAGARELAMQVAAHYLMRFLLAYASQCTNAHDPGLLRVRTMLAS